MKKLTLLFTLLAFIGCKEGVKTQVKEVIIDFDDITIVDGIAHLKHDMSIVNGIVKRWHENGQLMIEGAYRYGKGDGIYKYWLDNGQLMLVGAYKDSKKDGVWKSWHEDGRLATEKTYNDGELIFSKEWDKDGQLLNE